MIKKINHLHNFAIFLTIPYAIALSTIIQNLKNINLYIIYNPFTFFYSNIDFNILILSLSGILYVAAKKDYYFRRNEQKSILFFMLSFLVFTSILKNKNRKYTIFGTVISNNEWHSNLSNDKINRNRKFTIFGTVISNNEWHSNSSNEKINKNIANDNFDSENNIKPETKKLQHKFCIQSLKICILKLFLFCLQICLLSKTFYENLLSEFFEYTSFTGLFPLLNNYKFILLNKSYKNVKYIYKQLLMYTMYIQLFFYIFGNIFGHFHAILHVLRYFIENIVHSFLYFSFVYFLELVYVYNSSVNLKNYNETNKSSAYEKLEGKMTFIFDTLYNSACFFAKKIEKYSNKNMHNISNNIANNTNNTNNVYKLLVDLYRFTNINNIFCKNETVNQDFIVLYFLYYKNSVEKNKNTEVVKNYTDYILKTLKSQALNLKKVIEESEKNYNAKVPGKAKRKKIGLLENYKYNAYDFKKAYLMYDFLKNQLIKVNEDCLSQKIALKIKYEVCDIVRTIETIESNFEMDLETQSLCKIIEENE